MTILHSSGEMPIGENSTQPSVALARQTTTRRSSLVLVVEDHEDTRCLLTLLLKIRGFEVVEACDGEEAIQVAERVRPDLILMDTSLPRLDGFATTRRLRESQTLRSLPIVFLSGHVSPEARSSAFAAGCDDFLVKPLDIERLDDVLAKHLSRNVGAEEANAEFGNTFAETGATAQSL